MKAFVVVVLFCRLLLQIRVVFLHFAYRGKNVTLISWNYKKRK